MNVEKKFLATRAHICSQCGGKIRWNGSSFSVVPSNLDVAIRYFCSVKCVAKFYTLRDKCLEKKKEKELEHCCHR